MGGRFAIAVLTGSLMSCATAAPQVVARPTLRVVAGQCADEKAARCLAQARKLLALPLTDPRHFDAQPLLFEACAAKLAAACEEQRRHAVLPKRISGQEPFYTDEAREKNVEGVLLVRCTIGGDGALSGCRVLKSVPLMDAAVLRALSTWRMKPATFDGVTLEIDYAFVVRLVNPR